MYWYSGMMKSLASYYYIVIPITIVIVIGIYVWYSVRTIILCRRSGMDIGMSGMIPVWNVILRIRRVIKGIRERRKARKEKEEEVFEL